MLTRLLKDFQGDILTVPGRAIALVFILVLLLLPQVVPNHMLLPLIIANLYVIYAVSWDLLSGYTGQMNLGHALFFGGAGYVAALLSRYHDLDPWLTIPVGGIAAALVGLLVCIPALRLRGPYLSLVTLALPIIALGIIMYYKEYTFGELGVGGISKIYRTDDIIQSREIEAYISLAVMLVSVFIMWKFTDAKSTIVRTGLLFHAIREDEIAARACGINTVRYKFLAFAIGGFFAGIAGAFYAHVIGVAEPKSIGIYQSFLPIIWVVFGGIASVYGGMIGVFALYYFLDQFLLNDVLEITSDAKRQLAQAGIIVIVLLFMPEGIGVWIKDKLEKTCPRCKIANARFRRSCRACGASLHTKGNEPTIPDMSSG